MLGAGSARSAYNCAPNNTFFVCHAGCMGKIKHVVVRDRRLMGGVPARDYYHIVNVSGSVSNNRVFSAVRNLGRHEALDCVYILCHGFAGSNPSLGVSIDAGGMGLQLGKELLLHGNVHRWQAIQGCAKNIIVYSCAAANTESGNEGTRADGRYLMGALAIHTGADVYAADRIQWYHTWNGLSNGRFDFGNWEGRVYCFHPDGTQELALSFPHNLTTLMVNGP